MAGTIRRHLVNAMIKTLREGHRAREDDTSANRPEEVPLSAESVKVEADSACLPIAQCPRCVFGSRCSTATSACGKFAPLLSRSLLPV